MSEAGALVVATFNIRNGVAYDGWNSWLFRRRATAAMIHRLEADAVGLQEVYGFQRRSLLRRLEGYDAHGDGRSPSRAGEACPVLTRRSRLRVVDARTRWFGATPDTPGTTLPEASFPRIATIVHAVDRPIAATVFVVNTHLDEHRPENRRAAATQLVTWLPSDQPVILLGDLNSTEDDDGVFSPLRAAGLRSVLPPAAGGTAHNWKGTGGRRIDHILVSLHWEVVEAAIVTVPPGARLPSDHWPVRAALRCRA